MIGLMYFMVGTFVIVNACQKSDWLWQSRNALKMRKWLGDRATMLLACILGGLWAFVGLTLMVANSMSLESIQLTQFDGVMFGRLK